MGHATKSGCRGFAIVRCRGLERRRGLDALDPSFQCQSREKLIVTGAVQPPAFPVGRWFREALFLVARRLEPRVTATRYSQTICQLPGSALPSQELYAAGGEPSHGWCDREARSN